VVDADGHERVATIGVGEGPVAVACVPAMAQTYVANASGSSISVIRIRHPPSRRTVSTREV